MTSNQDCDFGRTKCVDKVRVKDLHSKERQNNLYKSHQVDTLELFQSNVLEALSKQFVSDQLS